MVASLLGMGNTGMKGLILDIYRNRKADGFNVCKNVNKVVGVSDEIVGIFEPNESMPAVKVVSRYIAGQISLCAYPIDKDGNMIKGMFGGDFVYSIDSRFRRVSPYPIPLHDRMER